MQQTTPNFDKALLQPVRLAAVTHLVAHGGEASLASIRAAAGGVSNSLFWRHSLVLQDAGYVEVRKQIDRRQVHTTMHLTDLGRRAFDEHMDMLTAASSGAIAEVPA